MNLEAFLRFSGICLILAGLLFIANAVLSFVSLGEVGAFGDLFGMTFLLLGLVGIYVTQVNSIGVLGFIAFILLFVGTVLWSGYSWLNAFLYTSLEASAPAILADPPALLMTGMAISLYPFAIGLLLFGLMLAWKGTIPRWAAILLVVAPIVEFIPFGFYLSQPLVSIGFMWIGYSIFKGNHNDKVVNNLS